MADKNDDLIIQVAADTAAMRKAWTKVESEVTGLSAKVNRRFHSMGQQIDRTFANVGRNMMRNLTGPLAGIAGVMATREVMQYADAWTVAGNKLAAAGEVAGMQARSLVDLNEIANSTRSGIAETADLYAKLLRSTKGVAQSELEVAKATEIVNKAFKAGGAAASEQAAGIMQLAQGLGSGTLMGDELRSVRENAPLLAQAIANYFETSIAGLKDLGSEGKLTSDKIFKAILAAQPGVEAAFGRTNATIEDGITKVRNALTQYIGGADQSAGATAALNVGLNALADDFDKFADIALKLAAILAGALVGRSILGMVGALGVAGKGVGGFIKLLVEARTTSGSLAGAFGALNAAAGPLALIIGGGVAVAMQNLVAQNASAKSSIAQIDERMASLGFSSDAAAKRIDDVAEATDKLAKAEAARRVTQAQGNLDTLKHGTGVDNFSAPFTGNADLKSLLTISQRAFAETAAWGIKEADKTALQTIQAYADGIRAGTADVQDALADMVKIEENPEVTQDVIDLVSSLRTVLASFANQETSIILDVDATGIDYATGKARALRDELVRNVETHIALREAQRSGAADKAWVAQAEAFVELLKEEAISAEDAKTELERLGALNPRFASQLPDLRLMINALVEYAAGLRDAKSAKDALGSTNTQAENLRTFRQADSDSMKPIIAGDKYLAELDRLNGLTRTQRDLEEEIARIRKDAPDGAYLSPSDIEARAKANLAWKDANKKDGGGKSDAQAFKDRLKDEQMSVDLLAKEAALISTLNPLTKDYETTLEAWRMQQELLNDARKAGLADDPAVIAGIQQIVEAWKDGTDAINAVQEAQDMARESMQEWFDLGRSATRGFIDDLIEGKTAAEALGNVFNQLGSKLLDMGLSGLFGTGNGSFGLVGQMFGLAAATGGKVSGPGSGTSDSIPARLSNGEYVVNAKATAQNRALLDAINFGGQRFATGGIAGPSIPQVNTGGSSMSGGAVVNFAPQITMTDGSPESIARLEKAVGKMQGEFEGRVKKIVSRRGKDMW